MKIKSSLKNEIKNSIFTQPVNAGANFKKRKSPSGLIKMYNQDYNTKHD